MLVGFSVITADLSVNSAAVRQCQRQTALRAPAASWKPDVIRYNPTTIWCGPVQANRGVSASRQTPAGTIGS